MAKPVRNNRVPIMFTDAELRTIDDFQHEHKLGTRADAVRRLCKMGARNLESLKQATADAVLVAFVSAE